MRNTGVAYLLWLTCIFGLSGVHRLYSGRYVSGIVWMFTLGLFGIGQLVDLALIPGMVDDKNLKYKLLHGNGNTPNSSNTPSVVINIGEHLAPFLNSVKTTTQNSDIQIILQLAKNNGGQVSLADCVIGTGKPIGEVKDTIKTLCSEGLLDVDNEPRTGAVIYRII